MGALLTGGTYRRHASRAAKDKAGAAGNGSGTSTACARRAGLWMTCKCNIVCICFYNLLVLVGVSRRFLDD